MHRVFPAALIALGPALAAQDEATFEQAFCKARELVQKEKWKDARTAIDAVLAANQGKLWVLAEKESILEDCRRCAFALEVTAPKPQDLITGKILSWSPSSGRIKLQYTPETMADWLKEDGRTAFYVHPAAFKSDYQVTIKGSLGTRENLIVLFDVGEDTRGIAGFGGGVDDRRFFPMMLKKGPPGRESDLLGSDDLFGLKSGRFAAVLKVGSGRVQMNLGDPRRPPVEARTTGHCGGQVAISEVTFSEVVLEGTIEPSWFQNLTDSWLAGKRAEFDAGYRPEKSLPAWLFEPPHGTRTPARCRYEVPGLEQAKATPALRHVLDEAKQHQWLKLGAAIEQCNGEDLPAVTKEYLCGLAQLRLGQPEGALSHFDAALAADPQFTWTRVLRAETLADLRRLADADAEYQQALAADPGAALVYERSAVTLLQRGQLDACRRLVRSAKVQHGLWEEMRPLDQMLAMLESGPQWPKRYRYLSTNYDITSDIDAHVCAQAGMLLEQSLANLRAQFPGLKEDRSVGRFRVFLFSGQAGYVEYSTKILGASPPHTAGLYSPVLKQLLIWNLPKREEMERTIRHEGFHQFLDRVMVDPPVWFNEGLAQYWESAKREKDRFTGGQVHPEQVATLLKNRQALPKLKELAYAGRADFYGHADLRYPHAWAFVHFLRHGPQQYRPVFQLLWESLRGDCSLRAALDKAFAGVDQDKLESEFWAYVARLH